MADNSSFDVLLFDFGGVLIEYASAPRLLQWLNHSISEESLWHKWLLSPAVRGYECGAMNENEFASALCDEFALPVSPEDFLAEFEMWPRALYPGTLELLDALGPRFTLASMSNTNVLHWRRVSEQMDLLPRFDLHFASHLTGLLKPDVEAFDNVVRSAGCKPERILFFDDNPINVHAAESVGLTARRVNGPTAIEAALRSFNIAVSIRGAVA